MTSESGHESPSHPHEESLQGDDQAVRELLLRELDYYGRAFWSNEEGGEKRVSVFLSLTAALIAVVGFLVGDVPELDRLLVPLIVALVILLLFGRVVLVRLIKRNLDSEGYKEAMAMARAWFVERYPGVEAYLYHQPLSPRRPRGISTWNLGTGGWLQTVLVANAILAGLFVAFGVRRGLPSMSGISDALADLIASGLGIGGAVLYAIWQRRDANRRYREQGEEQLRRGYGPLRHLPPYAPDEDR